MERLALPPLQTRLLLSMPCPCGLQMHMLVELVAEPDIIPAWGAPGQQLLQRASAAWAAELRRLKLNKARALPCVTLHVCFEQVHASLSNSC